MSALHQKFASMQTPGAEQTCSQHLLVETVIPPVKINTSANSTKPQLQLPHPHTQNQLQDPPTQKLNDGHLFEKVSMRKLTELTRGGNL